MEFADTQIGRTFICRIGLGEDVLGAVKRFMEEKAVEAGVFHLIGAVQRAAFSFYNQKTKQYEKKTLDKPLEVLPCFGNVSKKKGETIIHAHLTFSDEAGNTLGGHLEPGTVAFNIELYVTELKGIKLNRIYDPTTGLSVLHLK